MVNGGNVESLRDMIAAVPIVEPYLSTTTAMELMTTKFDDPGWAVPKIIPEGVSLLVGASKIGKSWLALDLAIAVASGGRFLGHIEVEAGEVLYLALEDTKRRLQNRLKTLLNSKKPAPERMHIKTELESKKEKSLDDLNGWLSQHPACRLVIIDTLVRIQPPSKSQRDTYRVDSEFMAELQEIGAEHGVAIVLLHHTRKAPDDDVFNTVLGSTALMGGADTTIIIKRTRGNADAELHITGRDVDEKELALRFDGGQWSLMGNADEYRMNQAQQAVLEVLRDGGGSMKLKDVAEAVNKSKQNVNKILKGLVRDGKATNNGGTYSLSTNTHNNSLLGEQGLPSLPGLPGLPDGENSKPANPEPGTEFTTLTANSCNELQQTVNPVNPVTTGDDMEADHGEWMRQVEMQREANANEDAT